jgi:hypothetical protein
MPQPTVFHLRTGVRQAVALASRVLPRRTSVGIERYMRGWEEARKLPHCDAVIVSFGKSGRTWFRVLVSRYFAKKFGLAEGRMMEFDEFHRANSSIPVLFFTHDNYLKDFAGHDRKFDLYGGKPIILLVRDPRDTAVSQYFQWKHRIVPRKKLINEYPLTETDLHSFITGEAAGIPKIIDFMNAWAADLTRFPKLMVIKYEDLKADTAGELGRALGFLGFAPTAAELADAAEFASVDNMRKMELENAAKLTANARLKPADASDPSSFKVRRAKVGGWRDYVTEAQAEAIDAMVATRLDPVFGYARDGQPE